MNFIRITCALIDKNKVTPHCGLAIADDKKYMVSGVTFSF